jgi:hypothetical protein
MKPERHISYFFILLLWASIAIQADAQYNSVFWKISGNGIDQPSYIFGYLSFFPKKRFSVPKEVKEAMKECEVLASKNVYNQYTVNEFNKAARIPNNGWINDYLNEMELNKLRILMLLELEVKESDYHDIYSRLQPIILVTTTTAIYLGKKIIFAEPEISELAKKNKLEPVGLGSIAEEIKAFEQFPIEDQVKALEYTVDEFDAHIQDYYSLIDYYLVEQDLEKVKAETMKATNESQVFRKIYFDDRNKLWMPKIEKLIQERPTFISIGAVHMAGESGLLSLLKKAGYKVDPIPISF